MELTWNRQLQSTAKPICTPPYEYFVLITVGQKFPDFLSVFVSIVHPSCQVQEIESIVGKDLESFGLNWLKKELHFLVYLLFSCIAHYDLFVFWNSCDNGRAAVVFLGAASSICWK